MRRRSVLLLALLSLVIVAAEVTFFVRLVRPLPAPLVDVEVPDAITVAAGSPPEIPSPSTGSLMLASDVSGKLVAFDADAVRPIASVAKTMVAYLVLQAHPLQPDAAGPVLTMTATDVAAYQAAIAQQGSALAVRAGEQLSERDLLLALLLPSANNIADTLARWVSGSAAIFVDRENRVAASLGMRRTHFNDVAGVSAQTVSTVRDLVVLAQAALSVPEIASIARTQKATLADGTVLQNLDIALSDDPDWLGLKTGWTPEANGCLLFAARHQYASNAPPVTVYGAVLDQPPDAALDPGHPELGKAIAIAEAAVRGAIGGYTAVNLQTVAPGVHGSVTTAWGAHAAVTTQRASGVLLVRLGTSLALRAISTTLHAPLHAGTTVAVVRGVVNGMTVATWNVVSDEAVSQPDLWWRLSHR